jgi:hypothetical protein
MGTSHPKIESYLTLICLLFSTMNAIQNAIVASLTDGTLAAAIAKALGDSKQKTKINKAIKEFLAAEAATEVEAKPSKGKGKGKEKPAKAAKGKAKPAKEDVVTDEEDDTPLEKKTVKELKEMCKEKELSTTGKKDELIARLRGDHHDGAEDDAGEASAPEVTDFKKMKVPELKALCKERGLDDKGKKDELIARLEEAGSDEDAEGEKEEGVDESAKEEEQEDDE